MELDNSKKPSGSSASRKLASSASLVTSPSSGSRSTSNRLSSNQTIADRQLEKPSPRHTEGPPKIYKELPKAPSPSLWARRGSWRVTIKAGLASIIFTLLVNVALVVWSYQLPTSLQGYPSLYTGDCGVQSNIDGTEYHFLPRRHSH